MSKMHRCGLIGYGAWGWHHGRVIAANAQARLVAIAARTPSSLARAQQDHSGCHVFADYRKVLEVDLDAVVMVLPSHLHFDAARAVLESGRHLPGRHASERAVLAGSVAGLVAARDERPTVAGGR